MGMKLFWTPISPPCRAVRMLINALKIKVDFEAVDILSKSYLSSELIKVLEICVNDMVYNNIPFFSTIFNIPSPH